MRCGDCKKCGQKIGWIGLWSTLGLGLFKLYIGIIGSSRALVASAFCSLTDVASAISIIASTKIIRRPVNPKYPYGYGKVEFVVSMMVSLFILLSTLFLFIGSFLLIVRKVNIAPRWIAFFGAIISSILSSIKYRYARCVARELDSPAIQAHAAHNKTDSVTSIFVAFGIVFARLGLGFLDPLIAIFETVHVLFSSGEVFLKGARGLLDISVSSEKMLKIENASCEVDGVRGVGRIRARQSGQDIFVDVSVILQNDMNVAEAGIVKQKIRQNILEFLPQTRDVFVRLKA